MVNHADNMDDDRDELLFVLLERLLASSRDGRMPDFAAATREHPELQTELRELWATAMIAEDFGSFSRDDSSQTPILGDDGAESTSTPFPRRIGDFELLEEIGRGGMVFLVKAGILSGRFYFQAVGMFVTGVLMALMPLWPIPDLRLALLGVVSGVSFLVPGWKYHRQRRESVRRS